METVDTLSLILKNKQQFEKAKKHFLQNSNFSPDDIDEDFRAISFRVQDQEDADSTEYYIEQELMGETDINDYYFESKNSEEGLEGYYVKGGGVGKNPFDFLKKYPGIKYEIENKDGKTILRIQKEGENSHNEIYSSSSDKDVYFSNSVSAKIGEEVRTGGRWYGDEPYTLSGIMLLLKRLYISDKIQKITKYPTTYNEFLILMQDYEPIHKFAEFLGYKYFNFTIKNRNRIYNNLPLPQYNVYFNVKGYLQPCYWNEENSKSIISELLNSLKLDLSDKSLSNKVLFGTRIGRSSSGNYGSQQGFISSGEMYLLNIYSAQDYLDINDWHKINEKDIELDSKYEKKIKAESKSNFKRIVDDIVTALEKNKAFQEYLKGIDSESLKGKGLKEGDSIVETFDKYVKVKTKQGDYVYVVLTTGSRTFGVPTSFAEGGEINAFTMRVVKGTDDNKSEVLTEERKVNFAKGGNIYNNLTPNAKYFLDTIRIADNKIQLSDITVDSSPNGNWIVYHKNKKLMIVNNKVLNEETIMKYNLEHHDKMFFGGSFKNKFKTNTLPDVQGKQVVTKDGQYVQVLNQNSNVVTVMPFNKLGTGAPPIMMNISDLDESSFMDGGKVTFKEKSKAIAKKFVGKAVEPKYQKEYGKTYDKKEAEEVGNKIAGSMKAKYEKAEKGMKIKRPGSGNPLMKKAIELAKKNRKPGQKWTEAVKLAYQEIKNN
jgi:hypothetical protein